MHITDRSKPHFDNVLVQHIMPYGTEYRRFAYTMTNDGNLYLSFRRYRLIYLSSRGRRDKFSCSSNLSTPL